MRKGFFKKKAALVVLLCLSFGASSCSSNDTNGNPTQTSSSIDQQFTLIGAWGMVSGTITDGNGKTTRYGAFPEGKYYEYELFYLDGSFQRLDTNGNELTRGVYTYNSATQVLRMKEDQYKYFTNATVTILSVTEINIFTDYETAGSATQYMVKVAW